MGPGELEGEQSKQLREGEEQCKAPVKWGRQQHKQTTEHEGQQAGQPSEQRYKEYLPVIAPMEEKSLKRKRTSLSILVYKRAGNQSSQLNAKINNLSNQVNGKRNSLRSRMSEKENSLRKRVIGNINNLSNRVKRKEKKLRNLMNMKENNQSNTMKKKNSIRHRLHGEDSSIR